TPALLDSLDYFEPIAMDNVGNRATFAIIAAEVTERLNLNRDDVIASRLGIASHLRFVYEMRD
ncbi:MAG TPA: hypothetical protein VK054_13220, partial [Beutenbergiaceae bacterium]|nr:hypothetical protein [Beutenbergiaceae bacterium]